MPAHHADTRQCPDCGHPLSRPAVTDLIGYPENGPLTKPTPLLRVLALAEQANVDVFDIAQASEQLAAAVTVGQSKDGRLTATLGLISGLAEDLRTDVVAFALALFASDPHAITNTPQATIAISRTRLEPAKDGPGHLARHMLYACGRTTPSATFAVAAL